MVHLIKLTKKQVLRAAQRLASVSFEPLEDQQKDRHIQRCGKFTFVQNELPSPKFKGVRKDSESHFTKKNQISTRLETLIPINPSREDRLY